MTEEEKEQSRQLNQISYINALNTHNWELQQKVQMLTAENEKLREALKPFAAAAITYEPCGFRIEWDIIPIDIDAARKALGETDD